MNLQAKLSRSLNLPLSLYYRLKHLYSFTPSPCCMMRLATATSFLLLLSTASSFDVHSPVRASSSTSRVYLEHHPHSSLPISYLFLPRGGGASAERILIRLHPGKGTINALDALYALYAIRTAVQLRREHLLPIYACLSRQLHSPFVPVDEWLQLHGRLLSIRS
jgi:hypothetical protein